MKIKQIETESNGAFVIEEGHRRLAELTYSKANDNLIIINHTGVSEELRGQGVGKQLVMKAVAYARASNIQIIPLCPFALAIFKKTPEIADVWKA